MTRSFQTFCILHAPNLVNRDPSVIRGALRKVNISDCGLGARVNNCAKHEGWETLADVYDVPAGDLLRVPNFSTKSLNRVWLAMTFALASHDRVTVSDDEVEARKRHKKAHDVTVMIAGELTGEEFKACEAQIKELYRAIYMGPPNDQA